MQLLSVPAISVTPDDSPNTFRVFVEGNEKQSRRLDDAVIRLCNSKFQMNQLTGSGNLWYIVELSGAGYNALSVSAQNDPRLAAAYVRQWIVDEYKRIGTKR